MSAYADLLSDLDDEYADLRGVVAPLASDAPEWDQPTPAEGWAVRDQISHLAFFDDAGRMAMADPDAFARAAAEAMSRPGDPMEEHLARGRAMDGAQLLNWWDEAHRGMVEVFTMADPASRVPWYGPPMGVMSFVSARLMETWAHGQDVADALGVERTPTDRLRHVAHLGVRARPFSYVLRDRAVPEGKIDVDLVAPSGASWHWELGEAAPPSTAARVEGSALDFCLVVTQRCHLSDTSLIVDGGAASEWMSLAQAFAGAPGTGRPPRHPSTSSD